MRGKKAETWISLILMDSHPALNPKGTHSCGIIHPKIQRNGNHFPSQYPWECKGSGKSGITGSSVHPNFPQMFWEWASTAPGIPGLRFRDTRLGRSSRSLPLQDTWEEIPGYSRGNWAGMDFVPPSFLAPAPFPLCGFFSLFLPFSWSPKGKKKKKGIKAFLGPSSKKIP